VRPINDFIAAQPVFAFIIVIYLAHIDVQELSEFRLKGELALVLNELLSAPRVS
jgi:hypothetical protein